MVNLVTSPLIENALGNLRNRDLSIEEFRHYSKLISILLFAEATRDLLLVEKEIATPLQKTSAKFLKKEIVFVPILRAGLAMYMALQELIPNCKAGFIGLERDEETAIANRYYFKTPDLKDSAVIILDPMVATGGSAVNCIKELRDKNARDLRIISIISAPEGLDEINKQFPGIPIFTSVIDTSLNDKKFILPGLGDFGDRYFGT